MRAVVYKKYGSPDVLQLAEVEKPVPKSNEVLIRVAASTVTSGAVFIRRGVHPDSKFFTFMLRLVFGLFKPKKSILGYEVSGEVESVGKDVTLFKPGDKVVGTTTGLKAGAYAEYVCVPEKWKRGVLVHKPDSLSFSEAAAIPVGGMAALHLLDKGDIQRGHKVLVYGASGSLGTYGVQLAKQYGGEVTAVCRSSNFELVKTLGADHTIDYTIEDFTARGEQYDLIFDSVGKISKSRCKNSLSNKGKFISSKSPTKEVTKNLEKLIELAESGRIVPVIDREFPLEQTAQAHAYVDLGHKKGNVIIRV